MAYASRELKGSRILIVEDNADLRRVLTEILQFEGFIVEGVASGEDALAWLTGDLAMPSLILTDLLLDGMDGCELLNQIRTHQHWRHLPVVFLSGQTHMFDACGPEGLRPDAYVEKPFTISDLVQTIETAITRGHLT